MAVLWLTEQQVQAIIGHVRQQTPQPACGLIAGRGCQALAIIPAADGCHLTPEPPNSLETLAWYRAHPAGAPVPTTAEHHQRQWPDGLHVLVELTEHRAQLAAWDYQPGRVTPVELHIGSQPPDAAISGSRAQTAAVLASAALAFVLLIALSLYLLPPAPPIP